MNNNVKKRKFNAEKMISSEHDIKQNIESVLFDAMNGINCRLISFADKVNLVDHEYYLYNYEKIDEFVGDINEFLKALDWHRKKVVFGRLNSDTLSHIFQFLDIKQIVTCGLVSKLWKESIRELKGVVVNSGKAEILFNSPLINKVSRLRLVCPLKSTFESLANCRNFDNLKSLDLSKSKLTDTAIECLKKCQIPSLNELILHKVEFEASNRIT